MELTKDDIQTYLWIGKCIHSCKTHDQLNNVLNLVKSYKTSLQSQVRRGELPSGTLALIGGLNMTWDHQENIINANDYGEGFEKQWSI
jgi:acid phosphatase family membrane protein YuiD